MEIISLRSAMISLRRTNQGGSVLTFIIVAVVLALGVIGTAYFVKQHGEQVRKEQAVAQADTLAKQEAAKSGSATTSATTESQTGSTAGTSTPVPTAPSTTPAPTSNEQVALPTTGPESNAFQFVAIGLLVASSAVLSRRALDRSL
jgi:LPXTG-motif cell wall-anchored protein